VVPSSTVEGYASKLGQGGTATDGNEPVYLIVGEDGTLTIASDNTRALNQLEQLVKRVNSRVVFEGHDYTIYTIKNTSASFVAQKLQLLLSDRMQGSQGYSSRYSRYSRSSRYGRYGSRSTRLEILPDETTNTIYVKGPKNVRREVEELIAMLDVEELPGMAAVQKPVKVQIENTQAMRILQQILSVYQQRLMATRLPGGVYPRISVDTLTNSIVIIAPDNLAEDIKEYAKELDEEMLEQPSRKLHVLPLEKVNTNVVQQALQAIYQSAASGYPTRMPYGGGMVMPSNPRSPYANRRNR
jgi:type II secretory pathway component GspD/PulD (secretin)